MTTTISPIPDYDRAVAFLMGRINYERAARVPYRSRDFRLARMERLLRELGDPHLRLPAVHIAGTKGKGSTAVMIESFLRAAGYRTGLYTSPHLQHVEERFVLDGVPCAEIELADAVRQIEPVVRQLDQQAESDGETGPTYFEITTAIAMWLFAQAEVDVAVLEVGLGGRLDSTNVCRPLVSIITSISFDHTKQLGNTLASIAREKAGIIKPDVPVISGAGSNEANQVIRVAAKENGSPLRELNIDFGISQDDNTNSRGPTAREEFSYWEYPNGKTHRKLDGLTLAMLGNHQRQNAALAIAAVVELRKHDINVSPENIRTGLAQAACPARIELVQSDPPIILDAAHNVASCHALVEAIGQHFCAWTDRTLIVSTTKDKDATGMLQVLLPHFGRVIFTQYQSNPRAADPEDLRRIANAIITTYDQPPQLECIGDPAAALAMFRNDATDPSLLCIAGSFFLAGEMRALLNK